VSEDCPECDGTVRPDGDEAVCTDCGLVVEADHVDRGPTWSPYDDVDDKHHGPASTELLHDRGLSTNAWVGTTDANGNQLGARKRRRLSRMQRYHSQSRFTSRTKRNLASGLREINRVADQLGLSEVVKKRAARLYREAHGDGLLRGRSIEAIAAAALWAACRVERAGRPLESIVGHIAISRNRITTAYSLLNREYGLEVPPPRPEMHLPRICSALDLGGDIEQRARDIIADAREAKYLSGKAPQGIAAAAVYVAAGGDAPYKTGTVTKGELADVAETTEHTIGNHWPALAEYDAPEAEVAVPVLDEDDGITPADAEEVDG
jgi:transcription initiation factor TFIIB